MPSSKDEPSSPSHARVQNGDTQNPTGPRSSLVGVGLAAGVFLLAGLAWMLLAPAPELDTQRYLNLFKNRQFETAESELRAHLGRNSRDPRASFLLAQLILEEAEPPAGATLADRAQEGLDLISSCEDAPGIERLATPATLLYYRGKALYQLKRWDAAEQAWLAAIDRDVRVAEANWSLLDLYYVENRRREARDLVLRLFPTEPDPRDKAQLLLELVRQDAVHPDSGSITQVMKPVIAAEPNAVSIRQALGLAKVRSSQFDEGLAILEKLANDHPEEPRAWDGWLEGLDLAARLDQFRSTFDRVPDPVRGLALMARHRGLAHQIDEDWKRATSAYKEAQAYDPTDFGLLVRLARAQRFADPEQARLLDDQVVNWREASNSLMDLYEQANGTRGLGAGPHLDLCERLANSRTAMGRPDEAALWREIGPGVTNSTRPAPRVSLRTSATRPTALARTLP